MSLQAQSCEPFKHNPRYELFRSNPRARSFLVRRATLFRVRSRAETGGKGGGSTRLEQLDLVLASTVLQGNPSLDRLPRYMTSTAGIRRPRTSSRCARRGAHASPLLCNTRGNVSPETVAKRNPTLVLPHVPRRLRWRHETLCTPLRGSRPGPKTGSRTKGIGTRHGYRGIDGHETCSVEAGADATVGPNGDEGGGGVEEGLAWAKRERVLAGTNPSAAPGPIRAMTRGVGVGEAPPCSPAPRIIAPVPRPAAHGGWQP